MASRKRGLALAGAALAVVGCGVALYLSSRRRSLQNERRRQRQRRRRRREREKSPQERETSPRQPETTPDPAAFQSKVEAEEAAAASRAAALRGKYAPFHDDDGDDRARARARAAEPAAATEAGGKAALLATLGELEGAARQLKKVWVAKTGAPGFLNDLNFRKAFAQMHHRILLRRGIISGMDMDGGAGSKEDYVENSIVYVGDDEDIRAATLALRRLLIPSIDMSLMGDGAVPPLRREVDTLRSIHTII